MDNFYMFGMYAFGLVECGRYQEAERLGREGTKRAPNNREPWAHHAIAHIFEMHGRLNEGIQWLEAYSSTWNDCNSFMYTHNWWHTALFHLDKDDVDTGRFFVELGQLTISA